MKWSTAISTHKNGELYIHGKKLVPLIGAMRFGEAIFFALLGRKPLAREARMTDALLVACLEHGVQAPSAFVPRVAVSVGNPMNAALAAGLLATGDFHGGAIEAAARCFQTRAKESPAAIVRAYRASGAAVPGYGHKIYKHEDPRAAKLFALAKRNGCSGKYVARALAIGRALTEETGKVLPLNVDGAIAAVMSELGFDWRFGKALFILGRMPGMIAHVHEEMTHEKPYRRLADEDVEYRGPKI